MSDTGSFNMLGGTLRNGSGSASIGEINVSDTGTFLMDGIGSTMIQGAAATSVGTLTVTGGSCKLLIH